MRPAHRVVTNATATLTVVNSVFVDNHATVFGGGLELVNDGLGALSVVNCTFEGNAADVRSGALHYRSVDALGSDPAKLANSILWGNTAPAEPQVGSLAGATTPWLLSVDGNDIEGGCDGASANLSCGSNQTVDPSFVNAAIGNLRLQPTSVVRNQGNNADLPTDGADLDDDNDTAEATPLDRDGLTRVVATTVDLGAFEVQ